MTNTSNLPVEALELEYPLTLLRYELVDGSGGPGTYRGGMGLRRVYRADAECRVALDGSRLQLAALGSRRRPARRQGRTAGSARGRNRFDDGAVLLRPGDVVEIITPGAGGYGSPLEARAASSWRGTCGRAASASEAADKIYGSAP